MPGCFASRPKPIAPGGRRATASCRSRKSPIAARAGDLDIPAFVFQPLRTRGTRQHPALVWVHENIRGHLYEHYIPYIREATAHGYIVIAPEYRGSIGYGKTFYDAIDYGGAEVDDVVTAATVVAAQVSRGRSRAHRHHRLEPRRADHAAGDVSLPDDVPRRGGAGAGHQSLSSPGAQGHRQSAARDRSAEPIWRVALGEAAGLRDRSPLFQIDRLQIPLLVHVADNDEDVELRRSDAAGRCAARAEADLADVKVYRSPPGGHTFDRRVAPLRWQPENTPEQRDSWSRVWNFLDGHLQAPYN